MVWGCACGFSCGSDAAFQKHLARFPGSSEHCRVKANDIQERRPCTSPSSSRPERRSQFARSPSAITIRAFFAEVRQAASGLAGELSVSVSHAEGEVAVDKVAASPQAAAASPLMPGGLRRPAADVRSRFFPSSPSSSAQLAVPTSLSSLSRTSSCPSTKHVAESAPTSGVRVRILFVRHARSENKGRYSEQPAKCDPGLSALGIDQAEVLGDHLYLSCELGRRGSGAWGGSTPTSSTGRSGPLIARGVLVVSSPMRRCLLTALPVLRRLQLPQELCMCHGSAYEFRGASSDFPGSASSDLSKEFPEFQQVGFASGRWDYRGAEATESEGEVRQRAARLVRWLRDEALATLCAQPAGSHGHTLVFVTHPTIADLICQILVDGTDEKWLYGAPAFKLQETAITELVSSTGGQWSIGRRNDITHTMDVPPASTRYTATFGKNCGSSSDAGAVVWPALDARLRPQRAGKPTPLTPLPLHQSYSSMGDAVLDSVRADGSPAHGRLVDRTPKRGSLAASRKGGSPIGSALRSASQTLAPVTPTQRSRSTTGDPASAYKKGLASRHQPEWPQPFQSPFMLACDAVPVSAQLDGNDINMAPHPSQTRVPAGRRAQFNA